MNAVQNPLLELPATQRALRELSPVERAHIRAILFELGAQADEKAEASWKRRKGPMAAYWRAVGVYARQTARALKRGDHGRTEPCSS